MTKIVARYQNRKLDEHKVVVDRRTQKEIVTKGELTVKEYTGQINVNYKSYIYLNLEALAFVLSHKVRQVDLGVLISMCTNLLPIENICCHVDGEPHTAKTIAVLTNQSEQAVKKKLNNLCKLNVLDYSVAIVRLKRKKVYRVNPHFLRIGKDLNKSILGRFNPLEEKSGL
jgi:hypothetical protein